MFFASTRVGASAPAVAILVILGFSAGQATAAPGNWQTRITDNPPQVSIEVAARDGRASLSGGCNSLLEFGFLGTLHGYRGKALRRVDDGIEPVVFDIKNGDRSLPFKGRMHYYEAESAWVTTDPLPDAFLDALSSGQTLTIRNSKGEPAVVFGLTGTSKAVEAMRRVCR